MNICLCIISNAWGGTESVVYELARHLRDKGDNVSIILNQENIKYYVDLKGVTLFNIGSVYNPWDLVRSIIVPRSGLQESRQTHVRNTGMGLLRIYLSEPLYWVYCRRIRGKVRRFLLENHIGIVQAYKLRSMLLVPNLNNPKIPTIVCTTGAHEMRGAIRVHPLLALGIKCRASMLKQAIKKADIVREGSTFMYGALESLGVPLREKFIAIPNGIDLSEIRNIPKSTLPLKGTFNLFFPGGARWVKGGDLLIPALARAKQQIPDIHLYVALEVPQNHLLRRMADNLGLDQNITFTGFLPKDEYQELLNTVDLLVMPSRFESFGMVLVEAMALGKPIVATNVGGIPEVVKDGRNGILVNINENDIADAIVKLYQNEGLRAEISKNNLQDAEGFDWNSITEQYRKLYRSLLQDK